MRFIGWVPNISGRLSFSKFASSHLTRDSDEVSWDLTPSERFVAARHVRITNDFEARAIVRAVARSLTSWVAGERVWKAIDGKPSDQFSFILRARYDIANDSLRGSVFIIRPDGPVDQWKDAYCRLADVLSAKGESGEGGEFSAFQAFEAETDALFAQNAEGAEATPPRLDTVDKCGFSLGRDGTCRLTAEALPRDDWPVEHQRAMYAFMFIRDLFHKHYHHDDSDDALIPLIADDDSQSWVGQTEQALYRSVIDARRAQTPRDLAEAEGRLSYLKMFLNLHKDHQSGRILDNVTASLTAAKSQGAQTFERHAISKTLFLAIPFGITELFVHLHEAVDGEGRHDPAPPIPDEIKIVFTYAYDYATHSVLRFVALLFIILLMYASWIGVFEVRRWHLTKAVMRAQTMQAKRGETTLMNTMSVLCAGGFLFALWLIFLA